MSGGGWPYSEEQWQRAWSSGIYLCDLCCRKLYNDDLIAAEDGEQEQNICGTCRAEIAADEAREVV